MGRRARARRSGLGAGLAVVCWCGALWAAPDAGSPDAGSPDAGLAAGAPDAGGGAATRAEAVGSGERALKGEVKLSQSFEVVRGPSAGEADAGGAGGGAEATVGSLLALRLEVERPADTTVALPDGQDTGRFELVRVERAPVGAPDGAGRVREQIAMFFAVYRPGRHVLEPFEVKVLDAEGGVGRLKTSAVEVKIRSVLANEAAPAMPPVREPVSVWVEDWGLVWGLGVVGGLVLAAGLGALAYRALRPLPPPPPPPPPRPAHEVALEKLEAILRDKLVEEGRLEELYTRVSEAVREYLGRRYNLSLTNQAGLELTTAELLGLLRGVSWPRTMTGAQVEAFLGECDIVKFARYAPTPKEAEALLAQAFDLVEKTRPRFVVGVEEGGEGAGKVAGEGA